MQVSVQKIDVQQWFASLAVLFFSVPILMNVGGVIKMTNVNVSFVFRAKCFMPSVPCQVFHASVDDLRFLQVT
jgi:hypothetical protein